MNADHRDHHHQNDEHLEQRPVAGLNLGDHFADGVRQAHHDAGEDDQRHAVADAALGDLLAQPHDERRAGGQAEDGHQR